MSANPPPQLKLRNAKKELGFGMPPSFFGPDAATALAKILAAPTTRGIIVETASWTVDLPLTDQQVAATFGKSINIFGTTDGQPPQGVADASNTLAVPGMPASDMILLGINVRVLVEPESRLIRGNAINPTGQGATPPGSPDVNSLNDANNNVFGVVLSGEGDDPQNHAYLPAEFLWGLPTWRAAYAFVKAYELNWQKDHQESLIREPLTEVATIQPFAEAEAAGLAFTSNIDRIKLLNDRLTQVLNVAQQFLPITHKRVGSVLAAPGNLGVFTPTREEDGAPTVFGGIGVPQNPVEKAPLVFAVPIYWPAGQPMGITFTVKSDVNQAEMQRWLSVTGGSGGNPGLDLNLPFSSQYSGFTATGAGIMDEQTLDAIPLLVSQAVQTNRVLDKGGRMIFEVGLVGLRISQSWKSAVYQAVQSGAIQAPMGYGTLPSS